MSGPTESLASPLPAPRPAAAPPQPASCGTTPSWDEAERLAALDRYAILDTGRETAFDDVALLAADLLDAPIAVVNLIAADRQWFKAEVGIGADTLPLDVSICRHAILQPGVFVVPDLSADARFDGNPLVHVAGGLRFYAGALLETPEGLPLGTVCVLDTKPRPDGLSERQVRALKVLADQTMARLELRRSEAIARVERTRAERHARRLTILSQASLLLLGRDDPATAVGELFALIAEGFRLDVGLHYRCGDSALRLVAAAGLTPEQASAADRIEFGRTVCGLVAQTREPVHVTAIQTSDDPEVQFLQALGIDTYFSSPLLSGGDLLGTLSFGRRDGPFSPGELEALRTLVAQFATALERRQAQGALRDSAERLELATENAEVGFWDVDPVNDGLIWPPRTKAMFGISADVPVTMADFYAGLHPEDREHVAQAYAAAADTLQRALYDVEYRTVGAEDGVVRWVAAKGRGVFDEGGACVRVAGTAIDVTARKRSEGFQDAVIALSNAIRDIQDPDDLGFAAAEILGRVIAANRVGYAAVDRGAMTLRVERHWTVPGLEPLAATLRLQDYGSLLDSLRRGELISVADVREDARIAAVADAFEACGARAFIAMPVIEQGRLAGVLYVNHAEARAWTPDEIALAGDVGARTLTAIGRLRAIVALHASEARLREVNETLEAQVAVRTSQLRFHRDIIEATVSPICAFDADFRLIAFNKAHNDEFRRVNGFDTKLGDVFPDLFIAEQRPVMRALMARALAGERFTVTQEFGRPELGQPLWEMHYTPLRDEGGAIIGAFHLATDISDRVRAEAELALAQEALRQSQKMEAIGSLTGGVAHDFNNLLTPIVGSLDLLQRRGLGGEREQRLIEGALQSAERAKTLVQRLLAFARRQPLRAEPVDVAVLVAGMADLVARTSGPTVQVAIDLAPDLPPAMADANQVEMAILNLAVNARDAMPEGGRLTLSAEAEFVQGPHPADLAPGRYVRLSVADTGAGMDEATLMRAVEPFFSTKGVGKGTGLGLSMVHGLAAQLGGGLTISSRPGMGTRVELWLPASEAAARAPAPADPARPLVRAGSALLVDDEALVRTATADMLSDLGYAVVEATSAEEALSLFADGLAVDLLVTDHLMPGMTGAELVRRVRALRPLPALVVSGYADVEGIDPDLPRLVKPFRQAELAGAIAGLAPASGA